MLFRPSRFAIAVPLLLASCVAPPVEGPSPPRPVPITTAPPPPVAPPAPRNDTVAPGSWTYARDTHSSIARFGLTPQTAIFSIQCDRALRSVSLFVARSGPATGGSVTLRATSTLRTFAAEGGGPFAVVRLPVRDSILDALAFSRGKFGVALDGVERNVPTWPEFTRVVEDCRG